MIITAETFRLVKEALAALGYDGPVSLSCDDSKLFPAFQLYWDAKENLHFLVGGTGPPLCVTNPDCLKELIEDQSLKKAKKVNYNWMNRLQSYANLCIQIHLWCLQVPLPKVAPIIIAALPIPETLNADDLFDYHKKIVYRLLDWQIHVISYACDGTETECSVQHMFLQAANQVICHTIKILDQGVPMLSSPLVSTKGIGLYSFRTPNMASRPYATIYSLVHNDAGLQICILYIIMLMESTTQDT